MALFGKKKSHSSHIHYYTTLKGMLGMLRDPGHTESVFDIEDGLKDIEATKHYVAYARSQPGVARLMEARYLTAQPDMERLEKLPDGTLGREFARHIIEHGFDPDYYRKIHVQNDLDWVMMRMRQTHDIWHVITGLDTSPIGELAVKAFELAQTRRPMAGVITAGGVFRYLVATPDEFGTMLEALSHGYQMGKKAKPFLAQKWEEGWDRPLENWRAELNVEIGAGCPQSKMDPDELETLHLEG